MSVLPVLWRRLDVPGHDACRLEGSDTGWTLDGTAVFLEDGIPTLLAYRVACTPQWHTRWGRVSGWSGGQSLAFEIERTADGVWTLNGSVAAGLESCADLDLGFTPATNLLALRRLALGQGKAADAPAAWLDFRAGTLELLMQRYERRGRSTYWYEAPKYGYADLLEVAPSGFVTRYPGLWEAEPSTQAGSAA